MSCPKYLYPYRPESSCQQPMGVDMHPSTCHDLGSPSCSRSGRDWEVCARRWWSHAPASFPLFLQFLWCRGYGAQRKDSMYKRRKRAVLSHYTLGAKPFLHVPPRCGQGVAMNFSVVPTFLLKSPMSQGRHRACLTADLSCWR